MGLRGLVEMLAATVWMMLNIDVRAKLWFKLSGKQVRDNK